VTADIYIFDVDFEKEFARSLFMFWFEFVLTAFGMIGVTRNSKTKAVDEKN